MLNGINSLFLFILQKYVQNALNAKYSIHFQVPNRLIGDTLTVCSHHFLKSP